MIIEINELHFRWQSQTHNTLEIPSLSIAQGESVFIAGPSGCGKSTLLNLLAGVITHQKGELKVLDTDINSLSATKRDKFRADHIGFIFQMFNLLPYSSLIDNICLPCQFSDRRKKKVLSNAPNLQSEAKRLLTQLDLSDRQLLNKPVAELSVGQQQQQRVAAARALMGAPELIIADEPTSALDHDRRENFIKLLFSETRQTGSTLLFVSHDLTLAPLFDHVINLQDINQASSLL